MTEKNIVIQAARLMYGGISPIENADDGEIADFLKAHLLTLAPYIVAIFLQMYPDEVDIYNIPKSHSDLYLKARVEMRRHAQIPTLTFNEN